MLRFVVQQGFSLIRIRGSHHFVEGFGKRTTIPVHGNERLKIGTLRSILRDLDLTPTEFEARWHE